MKSINYWLDRHEDIGILMLRLFIGLRLLYGVSGYALHWQPGFGTLFLPSDFTLPVAGALTVAFVQGVSAVIFITGYGIRLGAAVMVTHFLLMLTLHITHSPEQGTPALAMLFCCTLFVFHGAGKYRLLRLS